MAEMLDGEIVFTGEFRRFSRAFHREIAALLGATSAGIVRSATVLVVCGQPPFAQKKLDTAQAYGIPICTEDEFLQRLEGINTGDLINWPPGSTQA